MSVEFFFNRLQRAVQMDSKNEVLGRDCYYIREASEWLDAYKSQLSVGKQKEFDKAWKTCEMNLAKERKFHDFGKK